MGAEAAPWSEATWGGLGRWARWGSSRGAGAWGGRGGVGWEGRGGRGGAGWEERGGGCAWPRRKRHGLAWPWAGARACQQSRGACRSRRLRRPARHRWRACRTVPPTRLRQAGWAFGRAGWGRVGQGEGGGSEARAGRGTGRGGAGAGAGVAEGGPRREPSSDQAERVRSAVAAGGLAGRTWRRVADRPPRCG